MNQQTIDQIEAQLTNGWGVALISTVTPNVVRIQLIGADEDSEARYCAEGATLEEAIQDAIEFTRKTPYKEYEGQFWEGMTHAFDDDIPNDPGDSWFIQT